MRGATTERERHPQPELLVVDDEEAITEFLHCALRADYHVREAHGVGEALNAIEARVPDLVLTDLDMSDGGGTRLLAILAEAFPAVRRVIFSAAPRRDLVALVDAGLAHAAVAKCSNWSVLLRELERLTMTVRGVEQAVSR